MIVWLASFPRSGNTYFRLLLHQLYGVSTRELYAKTLPEENAETATVIANWVGFEEWDSVESLMADPRPTFIKTHELPTDDSPAVYIVRDGRDAIVSYAHFILDFEEKPSPEDYPRVYRERVRQLITSKTHFGGWSEHVRAWMSRSAPTAVIRYRDLLKEPEHWTTEAIKELNIDLTTATDRELPTFDHLKEQEPKFFRRGKVGSFQDEMTKEEEELFWRHHHFVMEHLGFER